MYPDKIFPALCILALLFCAGCSGSDQQKTAAAGTAAAAPQPVNTTAATIQATPSPTPTPTPAPLYPHALRIKSPFTFGVNTTWTTNAAVNRIWINDTYRWYNPAELQYDTRIAPDGKKYLFVFISMVNQGNERAPLPPHGNVYVLSENEVFSPYTLHPLPMQNPDSTPRIARIAEIEYSRKTYSSELVEDYGYSHGQKQAYINPGESNAVEGYVIFEIPATAVPEKTYVKIVMPDKTEGTWVLG